MKKTLDPTIWGNDAPFIGQAGDMDGSDPTLTKPSMEPTRVGGYMGSVAVNNPLFRSESFGYYYTEQNYTMLEKRQLFLRSYQFCRKKSLTERIKGSLVRAKKIVWLRLRSARRLRRLVFLSRFKCAFYYRRRRFFHLLNSSNRKTQPSSCLW
ncbi:hypothetical protein RJT34_23115 [Clitoria ternatea]|uniref:Uncharacterized protein n=1 Tax=Clitoria ternatea TaxID=43366 RepID=A0AAN9FL07_CLITE